MDSIVILSYLLNLSKTENNCDYTCRESGRQMVITITKATYSSEQKI